MKVECPKCRQAIDGAGLNAETDVAVCASCGEAYSLSGLLDAVGDPAFDLRRPPSGAWHRSGAGGWEIGATTRSWVAWFLVPFMCVWSGFSLGSIYGTQFEEGKFNLGDSLFGIPFILGSLLFWSFALMAICGKVTIRGPGKHGRVFVGLGGLGWSRRFDWGDVTAVREDGANVRYPGSHSQTIVLEGKERIAFGSGLNEARRFFVVQAIRRLRV